jgi:hypothetical protein
MYVEVVECVIFFMIIGVNISEDISKSSTNNVCVVILLSCKTHLTNEKSVESEAKHLFYALERSINLFTVHQKQLLTCVS